MYYFLFLLFGIEIPHGHLGDLIVSHDTAIDNLQLILEYTILATMNKLEGEKEVVSEVGKAVILLKHANELYQIKPREKISKLRILANFIQEYHKHKAETLKSDATAMYNAYVNLKRDKIPIEVRRISCKVFYDNEEYVKIE